MIQKQRQGITNEGIPLSSTSTLKEPLSQSQERTNQQHSNHKNRSRINYKASKSVEVLISVDQKKISSIEKPPLNKIEKSDQKTEPKKHIFSNKFKNLYDYHTSQSLTSQSLILSKKKNSSTNKKNHTQMKKCIRPLYKHESKFLKKMKLKNGKRNYYEGRLILKNSDSKDYQLFRVFTDIDLGIIPKVQNTIQEACIDDDCQTDNDQIKLAIRKSKMEVLESIKHEKRKHLIDKILSNNWTDKSKKKEISDKDSSSEYESQLTRFNFSDEESYF